jgi:hypothetical protein
MMSLAANINGRQQRIRLTLKIHDRRSSGHYRCYDGRGELKNTIFLNRQILELTVSTTITWTFNPGDSYELDCLSL